MPYSLWVTPQGPSGLSIEPTSLSCRVTGIYWGAPELGVEMRLLVAAPESELVDLVTAHSTSAEDLRSWRAKGPARCTVHLKLTARQCTRACCRNGWLIRKLRLRLQTCGYTLQTDNQSRTTIAPTGNHHPDTWSIERVELVSRAIGLSAEDLRS